MRWFTLVPVLLLVLTSCAGIPTASQVEKRSDQTYQERNQERIQRIQKDFRRMEHKL